VLDDAEDLDRVAEQVVLGAFWNMGENCSATSRLIVHESVKDDLLRRIGACMREWRTGDPLDPANRLGALVSREHFEKVRSYIDHLKVEKLDVVEG
jgi:4-(gamma-glutamylamino)butanal dehydrogenase